jgi:signal transduction histidine kinase
MRDRVDAVGGSLTVASRPGRGTTVTATVANTLSPQHDDTLAPAVLEVS